MNNNKKLKIGLALGGGGAKGLSHIGVIKILEENNIPIDYIAGSSIGALIGGMYSSGMSINKIEEIARNTNWQQMFSLIDISFDGSGLIEGEKVKKFINDRINDHAFEDCKIPFSAIATDLKNGESVVFNSGEMGIAIRASISIPLFFKPVKIDGKLLADGGLSQPVPVSVVRDMGADVIIAVNINSDYFYDTENNNPGFYSIAENSIQILNKHLSICNSLGADVVIAPLVGHIKINEFIDGGKIIKAGEDATLNMLQQIISITNQ